MPTEEERFWSKVHKTVSCWLWTGAQTSDGYGRFDRSRPQWPRGVKAHRYAWELENGPVPEGLELDHTCGIRLCVRGSHLEPVTHAANIRRQVGRKVS